MNWERAYTVFCTIICYVGLGVVGYSMLLFAQRAPHLLKNTFNYAVLIVGSIGYAVMWLQALEWHDKILRRN